MKRGGPLERRVGLAPGPGPERRTGLKTGRPIESEFHTLRRSAQGLVRRYAATPRPKYTGPDDLIRAQLAVRSGGLCEIGALCGGDALGVDPAHRLGKGMGGTTLPDANAITRLLWACRACHNRIDNAEPAEAERFGWKLRHGVIDPADVPVTMLRHGRPVTVLLTPDGGYAPAPQNPEAPGA